MIKLAKVPEPKVLVDNAAAWLQVVKDKLTAGEVPSETDKGRYRHADIKSALIEETHGKCAYCEGYLMDVTFGDVEHISPKSLKVSDLFRWDNLTVACDRCNTGKSNVPDLVDPYVDDPDEYFLFAGSMVVPKPNNAKAKLTYDRLGLNRTGLLESRTRRISNICRIVSLIDLSQDAFYRDVLVYDLFNNELADASEFAAAARSFIAWHFPHLRKAEYPSPGE